MDKLAINKFTLFGYSILALPLAFAGIPLYIHAPDFYSATLGVPLTTIGLILLSLRLVDAVQDPLIGYFSDKYRHKRKFIILSGVIFLGAGFYALFNPLENYIVFFVVGIFFATTGFSIISINLNTLGGLWGSNYDDKTRISVSREIFGILGLILAVILPSYLLIKFGAVDGFAYYSIIMILVLAICSFIFIKIWLNKSNLSKVLVRNISLKRIFKRILKNKNFFLIYLISTLASSIPAVLIIFFVRDKLDLEEYLGVFLAIYFISGAISMPIWQKISSASNKIQAWRISMLLAIISFLWAGYLGVGDFYPFLIICTFSGFAFGAELAIPPAILADLVEEETSTTEYSILGFLMKLSLAISVGVIFPLLEYSGYQPNLTNDESVYYLSFYYAIVPCAIKVLALIALTKLLKNQKINYEKNLNNRSIYVSS